MTEAALDPTAPPMPGAAATAQPETLATLGLRTAEATAGDLVSGIGRANVAAALAGDPTALVGELITDTKPFWQSKTLLALGVSAIGGVASHYGHPLSAGVQASVGAVIADAIPHVLEFGGLGLAAIFHAIGGKKLV
jgi:hypothetical protein